jgi:beta-galactosidase
MILRKVILLHFLLLIFIGYVSAQSTVPSRNDHIFPSATTAKPYIDYDARGFLINGKRTFIASADMDYARVPRALWHDRLLRLKRAGFNAIEMYTFWNFHEPHEGRFDFTGDHDLDAYLKLIKSMGMYAIVRVGPYYCGEWSMGGYPIWLKFKPGLRVREDNPQFLSAVDHFFDKLIPIVANNQINHGGSVIMVQLENEHRAAWGTVTPNGYFRHLIDKTVSLGLQVPYFFSGLHSGYDPAGDIANLDDAKRPNPWFSAEYWGVWFLNYGPQDQDSTIYDRRTWKIIAHGGNGYNVYMAHGGTNFDYNNDRDNAASYDYGASVGQAGDLRPLYYSFKRANWFARSFQDILANSMDEQEDKPKASNNNVEVTARKSPAGTLSFLNNTDSVAVRFRLQSAPNSGVGASTIIKLAAGEIMPVVQDFQLTPQVKLVWAPTRIYGIIPQGNTTTLLVYGAPNSSAQLFFNVPGTTKITGGDKSFKMMSSILAFNAIISPSSPSEYSFDADGQRIRIIIVNDQLASRIWITEVSDPNHIIIGPDYAGDLISQNNQTKLITEQPWVNKRVYPTWVFKPIGPLVQVNAKPQPVQHLTQLKLGAWQFKSAAWPLHPEKYYIDEFTSEDPKEMGDDGNLSAEAWYTTTLTVKESGNYLIKFKDIHDRGLFFLDKKRIDSVSMPDKTVKLYLEKNIPHNFTVFTAHDGRNKLIFKVGVIDTLDLKGLTGPVTLQKIDGSGPATAIHNWVLVNGTLQPSSRDLWKPLPAKAPGMPQLYRTTLNLPATKGSHPIWRVNTTSLGHGSVWVNGHNLGRYPEKIKINGLYIPECWLKTGVNELVIYDDDGLLPNKVTVESEVAASRDLQVLHF